MHLMESVTCLNMVLDKVIKKGGHAILASNADDIAIDDAIRNRSLVVKRERISDEQLKIAVDLFSQNYSLNEETVGEIKKMDLKDFREINMATRLRACGLDHQKTLVFMDKERKRKKKIELVYVG